LDEGSRREEEEKQVGRGEQKGRRGVAGWTREAEGQKRSSRLDEGSRRAEEE
jgi:hypothetical protein